MEPEIELAKHQPAPPILEATGHDKWFWPRLLESLDKAGYRIVKKPELNDGRGKPAKDKR